MFLLRPLILVVLFVIATVYGKPLLAGLDIETRANHEARARLAKTRSTEAVRNLKNFLLPNIYTNSFSGVTDDDLNRTISFSWTDPNSNSSSTICTTEWLEPSNSSAKVDFPSSYTFCGDSNPEFENWQFYFSQYTSMSSFQLTLAHEFIDPDVGPPPYDSLQVFATYNASLTCSTTDDGYEGCYLPTAQSPGTAVIYGFAA